MVMPSKKNILSSNKFWVTEKEALLFFICGYKQQQSVFAILVGIIWFIGLRACSMSKFSLCNILAWECLEVGLIRRKMWKVPFIDNAFKIRQYTIYRTLFIPFSRGCSHALVCLGEIYIGRFCYLWWICSLSREHCACGIHPEWLQTPWIVHYTPIHIGEWFFYMFLPVWWNLQGQNIQKSI